MKSNRREFLQGAGAAALSVQMVQGKLDNDELELQEGDVQTFDEHSVIVVEMPDNHPPQPGDAMRVHNLLKQTFGESAKSIVLYGGVKLRILNPK